MTPPEKIIIIIIIIIMIAPPGTTARPVSHHKRLLVWYTVKLFSKVLLNHSRPRIANQNNGPLACRLAPDRCFQFPHVDRDIVPQVVLLFQP